MFYPYERQKSRGHRQGFSLVELAVVLAVVGVLLAGVWTLASRGRQRMHMEQAVEAVVATVDATRAAYGGAAAVMGGISTVVPFLVCHNAIPVNLIRTGATGSCDGSTAPTPPAVVADAPWGVTTDANGSFRVCAWGGTAAAMPATVGTVPSVPCTLAAVTSAATTYFAIELTSLDYGSCIGMAEGVTPAQMPGLAASYINGTGGDTGVAAGATAGQTWSPTSASTTCANAATNTVDFVYRLHPPAI